MILCSIDQAAAARRQEAVVENIGCRWPFAEFEILGNLVDRPLEPDRVDSAEAVALHFGRQNVVGNDGAQAFQFEIALAVLHPADDLVGRMFR